MLLSTTHRSGRKWRGSLKCLSSLPMDQVGIMYVSYIGGRGEGRGGKEGDSDERRHVNECVGVRCEVTVPSQGGGTVRSS